MFKTFRSQVLLVVTAVMVVALTGILFFTGKDVGEAVRRGQEASVHNISRFIQLNIKNQYEELLDFKVDSVRFSKRNLKNLAGLSNILHTASTKNVEEIKVACKSQADAYSIDKQWRSILTDWFRSPNRDHRINWLLIDGLDGEVRLASNPLYETIRIDSFIDMSGHSLEEQLSYSSLSRSGEFAVFHVEGEGNTPWKLGYFLPLQERDMTLCAFIEITAFVQAEKKRKEEILKTLQANFSEIKIAETGFIFLFNSNKEILIPPPEERYRTFCQIGQQKDCLDKFKQAGTSNERLDIEIPLSGSNEEFAVYTKYFKGFDWYTSIVVPVDELRKPGNRLLWKQFFMIFGIFLVCLVLCIVMVTRLTAPLGFLSRQLERIPEVDFTGDEDEEIIKVLEENYSLRKDEIGNLIRTVAFMMRELDDNIKRLITTTACNERMEGELSVAREIQLGSLPKDFSFKPEHKKLDIYAFLMPAREIGGDLYDFFFVDDEHLCFTVGDVAGKGVPAALFMVIAKKLISNNAHLGGGNLSPADIMNRINEMLCRDNPSATFITLFIGVLNVRTGLIRYANGGHVPPLFTSCGNVPYYKKELSGPVVGVIPGIVYKDIAITFKPGEAVFICTDGVTEAMDEEDKLFGDTRLLEDFTRIQNSSCKEVIEGVLREVRIHAGDAEQSDDIAMMMIRWEGRESEGKNNSIYKGGFDEVST